MTAHVNTEMTLLIEKWINEGVSAETQAAVLEQAFQDVKERTPKGAIVSEETDGDAFDNMPV